MSEITSLEENKMGVMPIKKLLITMSLPMILSMLVQALYNVVDSIFVAQIGEKALTAVSLAFPIQNLMIAVSAGTGVGINALLSKSLGEKNYKDATLSAQNGLFLTLLSYLVFAVIGIFGSRQFFLMQTSDPQIIKYGTDYMFLITVFSIGLFFQITFERLLQSTGRTFYNMITQGTGAIINIILDPIFIFGLFGFPRMEVAGAALATVVGQIMGMLLGAYYNIKKNHEVSLNMKGFRPNAKIIKIIYVVGVPSMVMQSIGSVMVLGMNKILLMFSSAAVSVFGIYFRLQSFIFMPVFGLTNGLIPIVAYNYGARDKQRIMDSIWFAVKIAIGIMAAGTLCFHLIPELLLKMFNASADMMDMGTSALRIISVSFVLAGFCIVIGAVFQALGNGVYCLITSMARQLAVLLPAAFIFARLVGLNAIWLAFPLSELMSLLISGILFRKLHRMKIAPLEKN